MQEGYTIVVEAWSHGERVEGGKWQLRLVGSTPVLPLTRRIPLCSIREERGEKEEGEKEEGERERRGGGLEGGKRGDNDSEYIMN